MYILFVIYHNLVKVTSSIFIIFSSDVATQYLVSLITYTGISKSSNTFLLFSPFMNVYIFTCFVSFTTFSTLAFSSM